MKPYHILLINYIDDSSNSSGSSIRPRKMLDAFRAEGHRITLLTGEQLSGKRVQDVRSIRRLLRTDPPDLCYIESPTGCIFLHEDRALLRDLKELSIPTAYFLRDFYWKFPELFPSPKRRFRHMKDFGLSVLQRLTNRAIRYCDIVYFPSVEASRYFHYRDMRVLPPAGENHLPAAREKNKTGIYVGGIIGHYDGKLLLDTYDELNRRDPRYRLILVCRESEWKKFDHPLKNAEWLEVNHCSGEALQPLYRRACIAFVIANPLYRYNHYAVSVKLFEYLSFGLPVILPNNAESMADIISREKTGVVVEPTPVAYADAVERITMQPELYVKLQHNIRESLLDRNLWIHRVSTVIKDLESYMTN